LRLAQYDIKDRRTHNRVNQVYVGAKRQLAKILGRPLTLDERKQLFVECQKGVQSVPIGDDNVVLEISLPPIPACPPTMLGARAEDRLPLRGQGVLITLRRAPPPPARAAPIAAGCEADPVPPRQSARSAGRSR